MKHYVECRIQNFFARPASENYRQGVFRVADQLRQALDEATWPPMSSMGGSSKLIDLKTETDLLIRFEVGPQWDLEHVTRSRGPLYDDLVRASHLSRYTDRVGYWVLETHHLPPGDREALFDDLDHLDHVERLFEGVRIRTHQNGLPIHGSVLTGTGARSNNIGGVIVFPYDLPTPKLDEIERILTDHAHLSYQRRYPYERRI